MAKSANKFYWRGIIAILTGLVLVIWPGLAINTVVTVIGALLLVMGVISLVVFYSNRGTGDWGLGFPLFGIVTALLGILLISMPTTFAKIFIVVLGLLLVFAALDQIYLLYQASRRGFAIVPSRYIAPALILIVGVVVACNPFSSTKVVFIVFGITAILYGILDLVDQYLIRKGQ